MEVDRCGFFLPDISVKLLSGLEFSVAIGWEWETEGLVEKMTVGVKGGIDEFCVDASGIQELSVVSPDCNDCA